VRTTVALHRWLDRAHATGIALIQNFVCLLRRDILAVEAAVTTRWSTGPVEGQVNRLKMLKRQMYGRARVERLRARLMPLPGDDELFSQGNPNHARVGCPSREVLIELAYRMRPIDDPGYDHCSQCSPCWVELRAIQRAQGSETSSVQ
jgi:hypothetical protein